MDIYIYIIYISLLLTHCEMSKVTTNVKIWQINCHIIIENKTRARKTKVFLNVYEKCKSKKGNLKDYTSLSTFALIVLTCFLSRKPECETEASVV